MDMESDGDPLIYKSENFHLFRKLLLRVS